MPFHATAELHNIARNVAGVELKRVLLLQHFLHCVSASCDIARIVTQQKVFSQSDFLVYYWRVSTLPNTLRAMLDRVRAP